MEPISRIEKFLAAAAGEGEGQLPAPISRIEKYLAAAAGVTLDDDLPAPVSRIEKYLAALAESGGGGGGGGGGGSSGWSGEGYAPSDLPEDGKTRLGFYVPFVGWSLTLGIQNSIDGAGEIDWGDGEKTRTSGTSIAQYTHEFTKKGRLIIAIDPGEGEMSLGTNSGSTPFLPNSSSNTFYTHNLSWIIYGKLQNMPRFGIPQSCAELKEIRFDNTCEITTLPQYASGNSNSGLALYTFPKNLQDLGGYFDILACMTELTFPASLTTLGGYFGGYGTKNIRRIRFNSVNPPAGTWKNLSSNYHITISVPVGSLAAYEAAANFPHNDNITYIEE